MTVLLATVTPADLYGWLLLAMGALATVCLIVCAVAFALWLEDRRDRRARADMPLVYRDQAGHEAWVRTFGGGER